MRKSIAPTVATALAFIGLAQAQDLTARKVESAFDTWADASGIRNASLVLIKDNRIILKLNRGGYATATAEPAASNSKLITGLCIARLADSGQVSFFTDWGGDTMVVVNDAPTVTPSRMRALDIAMISAALE